MEKLYTAQATATGGRNGQVKSSDGVLDLEVRVPKEMGGSGGAYSNPEQLFAAGYAACFDSALNLIIRTGKVKTGTTTVTAEVSIGKNDAGGFGLAVTLDVTIPGVDQATAEALVEKAHQVCPYSNATRNNVEVILQVTAS
ncbi:organic hydroperoxide resistance protein [Siphonobacter sp. SORGH_AS_0500]|uniref:organic hydroperoxide resistance protein n=1 Tax=Siphonobacter sp. SORGH_AS_0500 TaxID=1864824 RepID=UPI000CAD1E4A|nr:organic hydroperoxide resistance protein [Siphonobacter sp. SORGH_AS_0500]PKK35416.1 organic hydroperoxide resistance protein [Siphonobacter sp. SORGH_AS_0500]